ncbi:MAG TPA: DUF4433 domain-containing protein [Bryobacteraceae bacterium]|nr:DUF4433 domain-containing protein [Bryobacteraceae bacterium]
MPDSPKIYHITHLANLPQMVDAVLWSHAECIRRGLNCTVVGMTEIKRRRLEELTVHCHPGTKVGEYVPFYFCFRSIMLYLLYKGNHVDLSYRGGQRPILHLEADVREVVAWANSRRRRWAFSNGNAGTRYTQFFGDVRQLGQLDWKAIDATDWRDPIVRERKQAEFLVEQSFPWELVRRIGVIDAETADGVVQVCNAARHRPEVVVEPNWYY